MTKRYSAGEACLIALATLVLGEILTLALMATKREQPLPHRGLGIAEQEENVGNITINGKTYVGSNISVVNDRVIIDGKPVEDPGKGIVSIKIEGDLSSLHSDLAVTVNGNVQGNVDAGNSVTCGNVQGSVKAGNSVNCGDVGGSAKAGNSVNKR